MMIKVRSITRNKVVQVQHQVQVFLSKIFKVVD